MTDKVVILGSLEGGLIGYKWSSYAVEEEDVLVQKEDLSHDWDISVSLDNPPLFQYSPHCGAVRTLAVTPVTNRLLSGGNDEVVKAYNLSNMSELESRYSHNSTVSSITAFLEPETNEELILTGAHDGEVHLWRGLTFNEPIHKFPSKDKSPVNGIAVHPAGALALTVNSGEMVGRVKKGVLKLLDLTRGMEVLQKALPLDPITLTFNGSGDRYAILYNKQVSVHSLERDNAVTYDLEEEGTVFSTIKFVTDDILLAGTNKGTMHVLTTTLRSSGAAEPPKKKKKVASGSSADDFCEVKCVKVVSYEPDQEGSNSEFVRIKGILRMDSHKEGIMHIIAMTSNGRALFWAADRGDIMDRKKVKNVSDEFTSIRNDGIRVSVLTLCEF